jgi:hypothetical protein
MQTISRTRALNRWDNLPLSLKEALSNPTLGESTISIARAAHLDDRRIAVFARLASYVLMGFIDKEDMVRELKESSELPAPTAAAIVDELYRKAFTPLQKDIESVYNPAHDEETDEDEARITSPELSKPSFEIPHVTPRTSSSPSPTSSNAPFVLHEEKSFGTEIRKESMKGFSLPFGLFKSKQGEIAPTPRATVEAPSFAKATAGKPTKEEKRVVHYSEYRTNLAPGTGREFINLETFGKTSVAPKAVVVPTPAPAVPSPAKTPLTPSQTPYLQTKETPLTIKKPESAPPLPSADPSPSHAANSPKVEGNMVDLR